MKQRVKTKKRRKKGTTCIKKLSKSMLLKMKMKTSMKKSRKNTKSKRKFCRLRSCMRTTNENYL